MDINTRIVSIQQVMSTFAHMCPKNSTFQLSSAENFHTWEAGIQSILVPYGLGLWEFFVDGSLLIPTDGSIEELTVTQLSSYLNRALHVVLITTVDADIIANFQCEGLSGFELLQALRRDFSAMSARQLSKMVDAFMQVPTMQPSQALKVLKTFRTQFSHGMTIDHLFGLVYLKTFNEPSAAARILDVPSPLLSLSSVENALRDLSTAPSSPSKVFLTKANCKKSTARTSLICRRCWAKGHISSNCTAPRPLAKPISAGTSPSQATQTTNISWSVRHTANDNPDMYTFDKGTTHLSRNREHFQTFRPVSSGSVSGITDSALDIKGYGSIQFSGPDNTFITVSNVAYVPSAPRNLISVAKVATVSGSVLSFAADTCTMSDGTIVGRYIEDDLYQFTFAPVVTSSHPTKQKVFSAFPSSPYLKGDPHSLPSFSLPSTANGLHSTSSAMAAHFVPTTPITPKDLLHISTEPVINSPVPSTSPQASGKSHAPDKVSTDGISTVYDEMSDTCIDSVLQRSRCTRTSGSLSPVALSPVQGLRFPTTICNRDPKSRFRYPMSTVLGTDFATCSHAEPSRVCSMVGKSYSAANVCRSNFTEATSALPRSIRSVEDHTAVIKSTQAFALEMSDGRANAKFHYLHWNGTATQLEQSNIVGSPFTMPNNTKGVKRWSCLYPAPQSTLHIGIGLRAVRDQLNIGNSFWLLLALLAWMSLYWERMLVDSNSKFSLGILMSTAFERLVYGRVLKYEV